MAVLGRSILVLTAAFLTGTSAMAQTPPDLQDLVGARGASGETQMEARGYQQVRATRVRDQSWTFWWSDVQRTCAAISTIDGRYSAVNRVPEQNCRPGGVASDMPPRPQAPDLLTLICNGQGDHFVSTSHHGYEWDEKRKRYESVTSSDVNREQFQASVQLEFRDGSGRIHLTGQMIPPLHSGGSDGWWQLEDVQMTPDRITAHYRVNAFNSPKVNIDRRTGNIEIRDKPSFSGRCDQGDWGAGRRF